MLRTYIIALLLAACPYSAVCQDIPASNAWVTLGTETVYILDAACVAETAKAHAIEPQLADDSYNYLSPQDSNFPRFSEASVALIACLRRTTVFLNVDAALDEVRTKLIDQQNDVNRLLKEMDRRSIMPIESETDSTGQQ